MNVPPGLMVDVRGQKIYLSSGGRTVEIDHSGNYGPFADGLMSWDRLVMIYLKPAVWQLHAVDAADLVPAGA